ncbi:hypothetical protein ACA910_019746 [Epithemia clementina (nom. ined.)]
MLEKFTKIVINPEDGMTQICRFRKGALVDEEAHKTTRLAPKLSSIFERPCVDNFFNVLDIAKRRGSSIGLYGVNCYYVLLNGSDNLLEPDANGAAVILDIKYQPPGAMHDVLSVDHGPCARNGGQTTGL